MAIIHVSHHSQHHLYRSLIVITIIATIVIAITKRYNQQSLIMKQDSLTNKLRSPFQELIITHGVDQPMIINHSPISATIAIHDSPPPMASPRAHSPGNCSSPVGHEPSPPTEFHTTESWILPVGVAVGVGTLPFCKENLSGVSKYATDGDQPDQ